MPQISVIMLTYNRKALAADMIADIRGQSCADFEFIIVDNGSNDGTAVVVDNLASQDPRLKVLHLPKSSIGCGRNAGIAVTSSKYVTFVDDDDRVDMDYLDFLLALLDGGRNDIAICGTDESSDGVNFVPQCIFDDQLLLGAEEGVRLLLERKIIRAGLVGKCFSVDLLRRYPCKEDCIHEDIFTIYKYFADAVRIALWGVPKYHFLRHGNNCSYYTTDSTRWTPTEMSEYLAAFQERTVFISKRFPSLAGFVRYSEWSYMLSMLEKIVRYELQGFEAQRRHILTVLRTNLPEFSASCYLKDVEKEWLQLMDSVKE